MEAIRKAGQWIWNNKERMVLVTMVVFLGYRVYMVVNPEKEETWPAPEPPASTVPEAQQPPLPDVTLQRAQPEDASGLVRNNPFTLAGGTTETGPAKREEDPGIRLLGIVPWRGGGYKAQVITKGNKTQYVAEGEQFENFQIMQIDPEAKTVEVFSNALDRTLTLRAP